MKTFCAALLAATMSLSSAFAADSAMAPLAPGKPAGVQKAMAEKPNLVWLLGAGLVIGGIALVATGGGNQTPTGSISSSSSGTSP